MQRKAPIRTCIACGEKADKRGLIRIVRSPEGVVSLDRSGKAAGRGAYICLDEACFAQARKKRLFDSRLKTSLKPEDYEGLEMDFRTVCAEEADKCSRDGE